jgi:hypothetical protein
MRCTTVTVLLLPGDDDRGETAAAHAVLLLLLCRVAEGISVEKILAAINIAKVWTERGWQCAIRCRTRKSPPGSLVTHELPMCMLARSSPCPKLFRRSSGERIKKKSRIHTHTYTRVLRIIINIKTVSRKSMNRVRARSIGVFYFGCDFPPSQRRGCNLIPFARGMCKPFNNLRFPQPIPWTNSVNRCKTVCPRGSCS